MRKTYIALFILVLAAIACCVASADDVITGSCGDNLTWTIENDVLTISGDGDMYDYGDEDWNKSPFFRGIFQNVVFDGKITSIGDYAFKGLTKLTSLNIPVSIKTIGKGAFCDCIYLSKVVLNEGIETIKDDAFSGCRSLTEIAIPESVTFLGQKVFKNCINLSTAYLTNNYISDNTFYNCDAFVFCPKNTVFHYSTLSHKEYGNFVFYACSEKTITFMHSDSIIPVLTVSDVLYAVNVCGRNIAEEAFFERIKLKNSNGLYSYAGNSIEIPDSFNVNGLTVKGIEIDVADNFSERNFRDGSTPTDFSQFSMPQMRGYVKFSNVPLNFDTHTNNHVVYGVTLVSDSFRDLSAKDGVLMIYSIDSVRQMLTKQAKLEQNKQAGNDNNKQSVTKLFAQAIRAVMSVINKIIVFLKNINK